MADQWDVEATLSVRVQRAISNLNRVTGRLGALGRRLQGTSQAADRAVGRLVRIGAAVIGIRLVGGAIRAMTTDLFGFEQKAEDARLAIATVLQVGGRSQNFSDAMGMAADSFERLRLLSIQTPATPFDLVKIQQGALAFSRAGVALEDIERVTQRASVAAGALGVDFDQASRDIAAMASGVAGTDVKLFRMLRNAGALTVTTQEWNELVQRDAPAAFEMLQSALAKFDDASQAVGRSWSGVTSTLQGIWQALGATARGPVFERLKTAFRNVAVSAVEHFDELNDVFARVGQSILQFVEPAIALVERNVVYLIEHVDELPEMFARVKPRILAIAEGLAKLLALKLSVSVGARVAGAGLSGAAALPGIMGGLSAAGGLLAGAMGRLSGAMGNVVPMILRIMNATFLFLTSGTVMATVMGSIAAAAPIVLVLLAALAIALAAIAIPAALMGAALYVLLTDFDTVVAWFRTNILPHLRQTWTEIQAIFSEVTPELRELGQVGLFLLGEAIKDVANVIKVAVRTMAALLPYIRRAMEALGIGAIFDIARAQFTAAGITAGLAARAGGPREPAEAPETGGGGANRRPGGARARTINDFRGSRFSIKQEFRQQDPDRIAASFANTLSRVGERRIASGLAPAVTR